MKNIIILSLLASFILFVSCEDNGTGPVTKDDPALELLDADESVSGLSSENELISYAKIKNLSDVQVTVQVDMYIEDLHDGHSAALCTGDMCFPQQTEDFTAPFNFVIEPGDTAYKEEFSAHCYPYFGDPGDFNESGTNIIKYKFTNVDNPADTVTYSCTYTFM